MKKCIACILSIIIIVSQFSFNMVSAEEINKNALMVVESYSEQNYTVEREDRSIKSSDNSGKVLLEYYYDKVVLNSTDANAVKINRLMQQECEAFFEDDMSWCSENPPMYENEYYVKSAQGIVTKNANGIFSIKYCSSWYMGGVYNINYNGLNYNLKDGSVLKITDLFSMSDNEVLNYIKTETKEYIDQHPDMSWWDDNVLNAKEIVDGYNLEDLDFYVENNDVCICYPVYKLGPGAMGAVVVKCPIINSKIKVKLNGNEISFDEEPLMINDRVMVPIRKIFEELGATVEWEEDTQTVTAIRGITFVKIAIGSNTLSITGIKNENISLDSPAQLINGRTYVPVRAVSEALNTVVSWNGDEQTVYISTFDGNKNIVAAIVNADSELTINDAALFREVLLKNKLGNVYEENISAVTEPSESGFDVLIRRLVSLADDDDISYFFYTGHGGHSNNEVVIAPDYSSVSSGTYEYTMSELIERLDDVRGTVVVILDSCYSGAINDLDFDRNKFKIITACSSDEYSFTENILSGIATLIFNDSVINGKFSSVMLNGLGAYEGGGVFNKYNEKVKADYDKDHNVTVAELYKYIEENIDKKSKDRNGNIFYQNPTCSDSEDETIIYSY